MITQSVTIADYSDDDDAVAEAQTPSGLTLDINGVRTDLGGQFGQLLFINCVGDNTDIDFIVVGQDENDIERTETIAGVNATNTSSVLYYKSITSITLTDVSITDINVGWSDTLSNAVVSSSLPTDTGKNPYAFTGYVYTNKSSGSNDYKIQYSYDDLNDMSISPTWVDSPYTGTNPLVFESNVVAPFMRLMLTTSDDLYDYVFSYYQAG